MTDSTLTPFSTRTKILSELWLDYRFDEQFKDFLDYNDLGLPLAYAIDAEIVEPKELALNFVDETFEVLLAGLGLEDEGYESLDQILALVA